MPPSAVTLVITGSGVARASPVAGDGAVSVGRFPPDRVGSSDQVVWSGVTLLGGVTCRLIELENPGTKTALASVSTRLKPPLPLGSTVGPLAMRPGVPLVAE